MVHSDQKSVHAVLAEFARTTDEIHSLEELKKSLLSGRQLVLKYGVDVTAPHIHIGHAVNLWMLRRLQELGHKVVFLIGDFTTGIGDPTGNNKTRPVIPEETIRVNAEAFIRQAEMVLLDAPEVVEMRRNSEWYNAMSTKEFLSLLSMVTSSRLLSRDMFRQRMNEGQDIYMHELIYPVLQGYDSVALESDMTIIGSDQLFNEMMGRFYQEKFGQRPQVIITTKITPGITGGAKQSKSLDNYIGLGHTPREKFGRGMSIPDALIQQYFEVYTLVPLEEIAALMAQANPRDQKLRLAEEIVKRYHGSRVAREEREWFVRTFSERAAPADAPVVSFDGESVPAFDAARACLPKDRSNSDIRRLFSQGGIRVDGKTVTMNDQLKLPVHLKIGKLQWFRLEMRQEK